MENRWRSPATVRLTSFNGALGGLIAQSGSVIPNFIRISTGNALIINGNVNIDENLVAITTVAITTVPIMTVPIMTVAIMTTRLTMNGAATWR